MKGIKSKLEQAGYKTVALTNQQALVVNGTKSQVVTDNST